MTSLQNSAYRRALAAPRTVRVYFCYLPSTEQTETVRPAKKRAFIAGMPVAGELPDNGQQAAAVGIDAILTDHTLELRASLLQNTVKK